MKSAQLSSSTGRLALLGLGLAASSLAGCNRQAKNDPQPLGGATQTHDVADNCGGATAALTTGGVTIYKLKNYANVYTFTAGMKVDADGSPWCYVSPSADATSAAATLDYGANATGNSKNYVQGRNGAPVAYGARGFYVSQTNLAYPGFNDNDPRKWVDAENIPYVVIPGSLYAQSGNGIRPGNLAYAYNKKTGRGTFAICAETGPPGKAGEGSYNLAQQLGIANPSPKNGGQSGDIVYVILANSGSRSARSLDTFFNEGIDWYANDGRDVLDCLGALPTSIPLLGFELANPLQDVRKGAAATFKITSYPETARVKILADGRFTVYDQATSFPDNGAVLNVPLTFSSAGVRKLNVQAYDNSGRLLTSFTRQVQVF